MLAEENKNTGKVRNFNSENAGIGKDIEHKSYLDDALLIERQSAVNVTINGLEKSDWRYDNVADCSTKFDKVRQKGGGV